jgi:hypothetical protein
MINYLFNFEKSTMDKASFDKSLNEYLQYKMNCLLGSNIWYLVTILLNSIWIRPNSFWQTKYCSYPILKEMLALLSLILRFP